MWNSIFNPDNLLWRMMARCVDFIGLSLFWALLCLPVLTIVPATAALYYTIVRAFRYHEERTFQTMWIQFKGNLKRGIPFSIIFLALFTMMVFGYRIMIGHTDTDFGAMMYVAYYVVLLLPVGWMLYLVAIMARFTQDAKEMAVNAFSLSVRHLPSTIVLVLLNVELSIFLLEKWSPIFFVPSLAALLSSLFLERIFFKYVSPEEEAKMRNMTLEELEELKEKSKNKSKNTSNDEGGNKE